MGDTFHEFIYPDAMMAGIFAALKPGGRLGVINRSARLGMKPSDYMDGHTLPQEMLIDRITRAGLRLLWFDSDFAGPPDGTTRSPWLAALEVWSGRGDLNARPPAPKVCKP
jgi:predicted methyltransferase